MEKNLIMTTRELAQYIKLNEKTIIKMAQEGTLPGIKVGNKWRFNLSAIDNYLQGGVVESSDHDLDRIIQTAEEVIPVSRLVREDLIMLDLTAASADQVLEALASFAEKRGVIDKKERLYAELQKREKMLSTSVGKGVAVPHPRNPRIGFFKRTQIIVARTAGPVKFGDTDDQDTDIFFMICAVNAFAHVRVLAKAAKLFHVDGAIERIRSAKTPADVMQVLLEFDRNESFISS